MTVMYVYICMYVCSYVKRSLAEWSRLFSERGNQNDCHVCMYVCIYVCMHIHTDTHAYADIHSYTCTKMHVLS
jgi:hypothetical protein